MYLSEINEKINKCNPNISDEELKYMRKQYKTLHNILIEIGDRKYSLMRCDIHKRLEEVEGFIKARKYNQ